MDAKTRNAISLATGDERQWQEFGNEYVTQPRVLLGTADLMIEMAVKFSRCVAYLYCRGYGQGHDVSTRQADKAGKAIRSVLEAYQ